MSTVVVDEAADAGVKGLVQIRLEGGAPQAPKAVTEGLSSQQIDNVLTSCDAQEVKPNHSLCCTHHIVSCCLHESCCLFTTTSNRLSILSSHHTITLAPVGTFVSQN